MLSAPPVEIVGADDVQRDAIGITERERHRELTLDERLRVFTDPCRRFPDVGLVNDVAALFVDELTQVPNWVKPWQVLEEGRDFVLGVAGGVVSVRHIDHERRERSAGRGRAAGYTSSDSPGLRDALDGWQLHPATFGPKDNRNSGHHALGRSLIEAAAAGHAARDSQFPSINWNARAQRCITAWSRKSRANMTRCLSELDYSPLFAAGATPCMMTLTYPGDWLTVAPSGAAVKAQVESLRKRWARTWGNGQKPPWLWKLEFQKRGAPHMHFFLTIPDGEKECSCCGETLAFRGWLSHNWADVVAHPDPEERRRHRLAGTGIDFREGVRARDPKRLAVYFTKHGGAAGGKEYQHQVPLAWQTSGNGPGRFWGHPGLRRVRREVYIDQERYVRVRRTLRKIAASRQLVSTTAVPRGREVLDHETGELRQRKRKVTRRRKVPCSAGGLAGGFLLVNNGPRLAEQLSRLA